MSQSDLTLLVQINFNNLSCYIQFTYYFYSQLLHPESYMIIYLFKNKIFEGRKPWLVFIIFFKNSKRTMNCLDLSKHWVAYVSSFNLSLEPHRRKIPQNHRVFRENKNYMKVWIYINTHKKISTVFKFILLSWFVQCSLYQGMSPKQSFMINNKYHGHFHGICQKKSE